MRPHAGGNQARLVSIAGLIRSPNFGAAEEQRNELAAQDEVVRRYSSTDGNIHHVDTNPFSLNGTDNLPNRLTKPARFKQCLPTGRRNVGIERELLKKLPNGKHLCQLL
jgi:hypothetical protein